MVHFTLPLPLLQIYCCQVEEQLESIHLISSKKIASITLCIMYFTLKALADQESKWVTFHRTTVSYNYILAQAPHRASKLAPSVISDV